MPITATLPPDLPEHAIAEIEADRSMLSFWTRWAAVGEAKQAHAEARSEWATTSGQYRECYRAASAKAGKALPRDTCGCGGCLRAVLVAHERVKATHVAVAVAIEEFKS